MAPNLKCRHRKRMVRFGIRTDGDSIWGGLGKGVIKIRELPEWAEFVHHGLRRMECARNDSTNLEVRQFGIRSGMGNSHVARPNYKDAIWF